METTLENPVRVRDLSEERLVQMRAHLVDEVGHELARDARKRARRSRVRSLVSGRRRVLVIVAASLAGIYAVPAIAQERWWWVASADDPMRPATQVLTVGRWTNEQLRYQGSVPTAKFDAKGEHWVLQTFVNKRGHLCVGVGPSPPRPANEGSFLSCGHPVHGMPSPRPRRSDVEVHWVSFGTAIAGRVDSATTKIHFSVAAESVRHVDLQNEDGRVIRVATIAAPEGLGVPARFWIAVLPIDHLVHTVVPRDEDGEALEHWRLPIAQ